jgi:sec-independent protein translocase protein TatB
MVTPPPIEVANLGMADTLILMVMALVVFGPRKLPQLARQMGKLMYEFRKASNDFKFQMEEELRSAEESDRRKKEEVERQRNLAANPPAQLEATTVTETPASTEASSPYSSYSSYNQAAEAQSQVDTAPVIQPPATGVTIAAEPSAGTEQEPAVAPVEAAATEAPLPDAATAAVQPAPIEEQNNVKAVAVEDSNKTIEPAVNNG